MATFWYTNAAPQWQTFNGNNWNSLENDARSLAARLGKDLDVYTGTYVRIDIFLSIFVRSEKYSISSLENVFQKILIT